MNRWYSFQQSAIPSPLLHFSQFPFFICDEKSILERWKSEGVGVLLTAHCSDKPENIFERNSFLSIVILLVADIE
jgi:hypothetical protein